MGNIYNIDWSRLPHLLLPSFLRKVKLLEVLGAFLSPLREVHFRFLDFRKESIYKVSHNGSVVSLTDVLNDRFDPVEKRIYIKNIQKQDAVRFYPDAANKEVGFYPKPNQKVGFRYSTTYNAEAADFIVHVPRLLRPSNDQEREKLLIIMRGLLDYYKLFGKNYTILWTN